MDFDYYSLNDRLINCRRCPRLVQWREEVGLVKKRAFADQEYWARPVPNFGDPEADLLIVGLAPAAHGANRTGRMFTGDRSGDWLYRAMYRAKLAPQPIATDRNDGLELRGVIITAVCHCAPPQNKPLPEEVANCRDSFAELLHSRNWKRILALGGLAWTRVLKELDCPSPLPKFGHGSKHLLTDSTTLIGSYHPSQQNTFTGRLTEEMLDSVMQEFSQG